MSERHELWRLADALQQDLRAAAAKMVEVRAHLAALDLPDPCGERGPVRWNRMVALIEKREHEQTHL